jgi:hypothetical protein
MSHEKSSKEKLQSEREKLKLPVKKQEILFYFTKDDAEIVNLTMSKVRCKHKEAALSD